MFIMKEFAWNTFINTGNIDAYFLYKETEKSDKLSKEEQVTREEVAISN